MQNLPLIILLCDLIIHLGFNKLNDVIDYPIQNCLHVNDYV